MDALPLVTAPRELLPFDGSAVLHEQFLDRELANRAFDELLSTNKWEEHDIVVFGQRHREPRLSTWHAVDGKEYEYSGLLRTPLAMTPLLSDLRQRCEQVSGAKFNSVLVNLYRDGNDGVGWHADNEAVNGREPTIASISLGATRRFDLRHRESKETVKVDLHGGSLLVMSGLSQHCWVHQVAKTKQMVGPRINLTFRRVLN
ncbi:MAG: alpha-ketoglutarate-dependent dioxygenase AlkB family protein [Ilumatobacteraceae bacterium]